MTNKQLMRYSLIVVAVAFTISFLVTLMRDAPGEPVDSALPIESGYIGQ